MEGSNKTQESDVAGVKDAMEDSKKHESDLAGVEDAVEDSKDTDVAGGSNKDENVEVAAGMEMKASGSRSADNNKDENVEVAAGMEMKASCSRSADNRNIVGESDDESESSSSEDDSSSSSSMFFNYGSSGSDSTSQPLRGTHLYGDATSEEEEEDEPPVSQLRTHRWYNIWGRSYTKRQMKKMMKVKKRLLFEE